MGSGFANFVINLERDAERLEKAAAQFADAGLAFERVDAVDLRTLAPEDLRRECPPVRFFLGACRRARPGEVACCLSHRKCWREIERRGLPFAAVCEDDVLFDAALLRESLESIAATDDPAVPTVWLMNRGLPRPRGAEPDGTWYDLLSTDDVARSFGAYCYAVNAAGAKRLAEMQTPVSNILDAWSVYARCGVRVLAASCPCATTWSVSSTISRRSGSLWRHAWFRRLHWLRYRVGMRIDLFLKRFVEGRR